MKKLLMTLALGAFVAGGVLGCEASAKVGDPNTSSMDSSNSTYKKTTTVQQPNGDTQTKTEVKTY